MEYKCGFFLDLKREKSSTPSNMGEDPGTDDPATVTATCASLHGTLPGDNASEDARSGVVRRIPPRKEVPEGSKNPSEAFLAMAATEDFLATKTDVNLMFKKMMDEMEETTQRLNNEMEETTKRLNNCFN